MQQNLALEDAEVFAVEFDPDTVGGVDVEAVLHAAIGAQVFHPVGVELGPCLLEPLERDRDGDVLDRADVSTYG